MPPEAHRRGGGYLTHPWVLAALWALAVATAALLIRRYWIPLDDGTLAQSAERVLAGQLPHRDFADPYSGLNALLGAAAFKLFGVRLISLRIPLVAAFAVWLPGVWLLARRTASSAGALWVSVLAVTGSMLAYPAAMPTWFALFAVTWGVWFLLRGLEGTGGRRWLFAAGLMAGVALLFKVVGLYFLAASLLSVAWRRSDGTRVGAAVLVAGVGAFLVVLARLLMPVATPSVVYTFFLPTAALAVPLVRRGLTRPPDPSTGSGTMVADGTALLMGVALPVAIFLLPYAASGSVGAWMDGVFFAPGRRFQSASSPPGSVWTLVPGAVAVGLAVAAARIPPRVERWAALFLAAGLAVGLALDDALEGGVMGVLWYGARGWLPALALVSAAILVSRSDAASDPHASSGPAESDAHSEGAGRNLALFALLTTASLWALVQFPYAAPAYFFYVAPLAVLATAAAAREGVLRPGPVLTLAAVVYLFLAAGYVTGVAASGTAPLALERGGLRVSPADANLYADLTDEVARHLDGGGLWAGPDAPEVYFLAGIPNPTRTLYEFLDSEPLTPDGLDGLVREHDVRVAVLNTRPLFSPVLDGRLLDFLVTRFPERRSVGPFVVRWRTP